MKIGLVCPYNIAKGGGVLEIVRAMQRELQARGHQALIITPTPRAAEAEDMRAHKKDGVIFVGGGADFKSPLHTTSQFSMASDLYGIEQMLEDEQFDTAVSSSRLRSTALVYGVTTLATVLDIIVSGNLAWNVATLTDFERARICRLSMGTQGS